jgi:hypothetical protein
LFSSAVIRWAKHRLAKEKRIKMHSKHRLSVVPVTHIPFPYFHYDDRDPRLSAHYDTDQDIVNIAQVFARYPPKLASTINTKKAKSTSDMDKALVEVYDRVNKQEEKEVKKEIKQPVVKAPSSPNSFPTTLPMNMYRQQYNIKHDIKPTIYLPPTPTQLQDIGVYKDGEAIDVAKQQRESQVNQNQNVRL